MPAKLRHYRTQRGLSQQELADLARISRTTIMKLEAGTQNPRPRTRRKLAKALRIDVAQLLTADT